MKNDRDLTFNQFFFLFATKWKFFLISCMVFLLIALVKFKFFPEYTGTGRLIIKDFNNSQLQLSLVQVTIPDEEKKNAFSKSEDSFSQTEAFLESHFFYQMLSKKLLDLQKINNKFFFDDFLQANNLKKNDPQILDSLADLLHRLITFQKIKSNILTIEVKTSSRDLSAYLVNQALIVARDEIVQRELDDLSLAEKYFSEELLKKKMVILQIENKTLSKMNNHQIYSISSEKNESIEYINELRKNINNIKIEILANSSKLDSLGKFNDHEVNSGEKYSLANQAFTLQEQNKSLQIKMAALKNFLDDFERSRSKLLPLEYEIEQQNALHQLEYKIFDSLKANLARIGLQKIYVQNKVSVLEFERAAHLNSSPSLLTLLLTSQALAFCFSFFVIFSLELLNENWSNDENHILNNAFA